jgi:hypothetical protein
MADWKALIAALDGVEYRRGLITDTSPVHRIAFEPGLSDPELEDIESRYGIRFPPDLREFLRTGVPRGDGFPDWRSGDERKLRAWLDEPRVGLLFDVQNNGFWLPGWGARPATEVLLEHRVHQLVAAAPRLLPVYGHRMIPELPASGLPVLSVHQSDIIVYGRNLADYLRREFGLTRPMDEGSGEEVKYVEFWSDIVAVN